MAERLTHLQDLDEPVDNGPTRPTLCGLEARRPRQKPNEYWVDGDPTYHIVGMAYWQPAVHYREQHNEAPFCPVCVVLFHMRHVDG